MGTGVSSNLTDAAFASWSGFEKIVADGIYALSGDTLSTNARNMIAGNATKTLTMDMSTVQGFNLPGTSPG